MATSTEYMELLTNLFIAIYDELPEPKMKSKKGIMNEKRID